MSNARLTAASAAALAARGLENIAREYPNHTQSLLRSDADLVPPRVRHPVFFGAFDWHSAVHNHWLLVRLLGAHADLPLRDEIVAALDGAFDGTKTRVEAAYLAQHPAFERPYGLAWLVLLHAEAASRPPPVEPAWAAALEPVAAAAKANLLRWLSRLRYPVRSGTHHQTAFALTLLFDAAQSTGDAEMLDAVRSRALELYRGDRDAPLRYEPSGEDFLSPTLMEADLMRRVLGASDFARWLDRFLPDLPERDAPGWLDCGRVDDPTDGRLVHLHGLNLSRAWNLASVAAALPSGDPRRETLETAAARHRAAGVEAALDATDYAATHWLPTFVVYLLER